MLAPSLPTQSPTGHNVIGGLLVVLALAFLLPPAFGLSHYTVTDDAMSGTIDKGSVVFAE